jgi:hypothetical protein
MVEASLGLAVVLALGRVRDRLLLDRVYPNRVTDAALPGGKVLALSRLSELR